MLVAKAIANLIPESNASQWQPAFSESPPVRCFQVDREILAAAHPWDCVRSALYASRVFRPEPEAARALSNSARSGHAMRV